MAETEPVLDELILDDVLEVEILAEVMDDKTVWARRARPLSIW